MHSWDKNWGWNCKKHRRKYHDWASPAGRLFKWQESPVVGALGSSAQGHFQSHMMEEECSSCCSWILNPQLYGHHDDQLWYIRGWGEPQQSRASTTIQEDQMLVPITHNSRVTTACDFSSKGSETSGFCAHPCPYTQTHTSTHLKIK